MFKCISEGPACLHTFSELFRECPSVDHKSALFVPFHFSHSIDKGAFICLPVLLSVFRLCCSTVPVTLCRLDNRLKISMLPNKVRQRVASAKNRKLASRTRWTRRLHKTKPPTVEFF